jgi:KDO2-lipid IV(A) lauroyltransferase
MAKVFSKLGYFFATRQRCIALEGLRIAFGNEKSEKELKDIIQKCFLHMAKSGMEMLFLMERAWLIKERCKVFGKENLDSALSKGKGLILVSAHFGNFPLMLAKLSLEGYKVNVIVRHMRDQRIENYFEEKRRFLNIHSIHTQPKDECVKKSIEALRRNEILCIQLDQNFGQKGGVFVDFFGRKAATAIGPVIFSLRTKAPILPTFIIRERDDTHRIIIEPELKLQEKGDYKETLIFNIQRITKIIENYIHKYPAEWGWIHKRWKTRPKEVRDA